eukprot:586154-Amphidinium_carterae.1
MFGVPLETLSDYLQISQLTQGGGGGGDLGTTPIPASPSGKTTAGSKKTMSERHQVQLRQKSLPA